VAAPARPALALALAVAVVPLAVALAGCGGHHKPAAAAPTAPARESRTALARFGPDRIAYDLDLDHAAHRLTGSQRIAFRNPFPQPLTHVWLRAWDNAYGSCRHPRVRVTVTAGGHLTARRRGCTALRVDLDRPVSQGARGTVALAIDVTPPRRFDRFGRLGPIDVLGNALPVLAVSDRGAEPRLRRYSFTGESFFSLAADWTVRLRMRPGEQVASTGTAGPDGVLSARDERDFTLVVGPMQRREATAPVSGVRVRWFSRAGTPSGEQRAGLRISVAAVDALQRMLGPYGASELDVLDVPPRIVNGGIAMEYPQLILSPAYAPAVSHEIAHQWFFRLVGDDEWSDPWVDETLTEFAAVRAGRRVHGPDRLGGCATRTRPARPPAPVDSDMGTLERRNRRTHGHVSRDTLYVEGPCALFNLQRRIGRAHMDAFLRRLVADHRNGVLTGAALTAAIAKLPGGGAALRELRIRR
jgi:Peptidase family M1 domain